MASTSSPNFLAPVDVKLNGSNYKECYTTAYFILLGLELLGHVDITSSPPTETDTSSASASWFTADHCVMSLICQSCEVYIHIEIGHLSTTRAMWDHLSYMSSFAR